MTKRIKTKHPLYNRWNVMRHRCRNRNYRDYKYYGAIGIDVCEEWYDDFWAYADYMMSLPNALKKGYSLDRIDNNKGYFPGNIRWATKSQQSSNRSRYGKGYTKSSKPWKNPWKVQPVLGGKQVYGGSYATEEEAKARVAEMIKEYEENEE
jgi:hypothetical protein